jgi:glyoxalase family protein
LRALAVEDAAALVVQTRWRLMKLQGLHHITMITGDAQRNVDFYADLLGLRLAKKTVNFDQPDAYHFYYCDEQGSPGTLLAWFEFRDAASGRAGAGMVHLIQLGVASELHAETRT